MTTTAHDTRNWRILSTPTSLGTPRARISPHDTDEEIVTTPDTEVLDPGETATFQALINQLRTLKRQRGAKPSIKVVAYVDEMHSSVDAIHRWLAPSTRSTTSGHLALGEGDRLHLCSTEPTHTMHYWRDHFSDVSGRTTPFETVMHDNSDDRHVLFERTGFADVVLQLSSSWLTTQPRDLWAPRSNVIIVPPRAHYSVDLLERLKLHASATVFLADPRSTRVWQHFLAAPRIDRLIACLTMLADILDRDDATDAEADLTQFLHAVYVVVLPQPAKDELTEAITTNPLLNRLNLPLP